MKISVIVPFWNSENWIDRCCESLTDQDGDFEFLLIDDFSTDHGAEIVQEYAKKDNRFKFLLNERRKGVSGARNTGLDHATGEWITFLDADDEMLERAFTTFLTVIQSTSGDMLQLNHMRYYPKLNRTAIKYTNEGGIYTAANLPICWWAVWNKLIRKDLVQDIRFDESMRYGEDGIFVLEILAKCKEIHHAAKRIVAIKRWFINQESLAKIKNEDDLIKQVRSYEDFLIRQDDPILRQAVCGILAEFWTTPHFLKILGHKDI